MGKFEFQHFEFPLIFINEKHVSCLKLSEANLLLRDVFYRKDSKIAKGLEIMSESSPPTSLCGQNGLKDVLKKPRIERITRMNQSEIPDEKIRWIRLIRGSLFLGVLRVFAVKILLAI